MRQSETHIFLIACLKFNFLIFQIARKYPDIGQVEVDRLGHIVGGVNPFEGTEVKLEDQYLSDYDEVGAGEFSHYRFGTSLCLGC